MRKKVLSLGFLSNCFLTLEIFSFLCSSSAFAQKSYESFFVKVEDQKISVVSPKERKKIVTIVVQNETFDKIFSEIRTENKTLKRFALQPSGKKGSTYTLTVDFTQAKKIFYVSIAPPFQEVPLVFSERNYEVP